MAKRRPEKEAKKELTIEQRLDNLEGAVNPSNPRIIDIHFLVSTIRQQQEQAQNIMRGLKQLQMDNGLKNSFLQEKGLLEEFKEYAEKMMAPKENPQEQQTGEIKQMTDEQKKDAIAKHVAKKIAEDEKRVVNEADKSDDNAEEVINDTKKEVVNDGSQE